MGTGGPRNGRHDLVAQSAARWRNELFEDGVTNHLVFYRRLRRGTLDLEDADQAARYRLAQGNQVRLTQLYPDPDLFSERAKNLATIIKEIKKQREERGIEVGYLAAGMATWDDDQSRPPCAPVLLFPLEITRSSARDLDVKIVAGPEYEINPSLPHYLRQRFQTDLSVDDLVGAETGAADPSVVLGQIGKLVQGVPGFRIDETWIIGTFSYAKLPMVKDLEEAGELLAANDVIAAVAGDIGAEERLRLTGNDVDLRQPDVVPIEDEFLVFDADSSQSRVINRVVAGRSLVVKGPPGTGKSQTIANLIATLAARGRSTLFVAEKRAAIDAVLRRLEQAGLSSLVLDLHDGGKNRRRVCEQLKEAVYREEADGWSYPRKRELEEARRRCVAHDDVLHTHLAPWQVTPFDAQAQWVATPERLRLPIRWTGARLSALGPDAVRQIRLMLVEYGELSRKPSKVTSAPWANAAVITHDDVTSLIAQVRDLCDRVPRVRDAAASVARAAGLPVPESIPADGGVARAAWASGSGPTPVRSRSSGAGA